MRKVDTLDISFITPSIMAHDNCSKSSECGLSCSCATRNLPSARPAGAGAAAHMRGEQWHVFAWCSVFIRSLRNFRIQHLQLLHLPTAETKDLFSPSLLHLFTSLANIKIVPGAREEADFEPFNDLRFPVPTTRSPLRLRTIVFGAAELLACNDFNSLTLCDNGPGFSLDHLAGTQEENRSLDQLGLAMHQRHLQVLHLDLWRSDRESIADVIQRLRPEGSRISVISECIHTYECYAPKAPAPAPAKCCRAANWTTISEIFQVVPWLKTYVLRQGALPMQYGLGKLRKLKTRRQFLSFIKLGFGNVSLDRAGLRVIFEFGKPPAWATSTRSGQMTAGRWFAFVFERMPDGEWELYDDESGTMCDEDSRDAFYLTPPSSRLPRKKRREIKQEREEAENGITPGSSSATGLLPPPNLVVA
ncbi:hypothetical protein DL93DRAFT_744234 [Clavulina sp. PMI_390]|nr:hypothetical protein DL93DRAFT_744234 [Clavulina sp. PMI_390]